MTRRACTSLAALLALAAAPLLTAAPVQAGPVDGQVGVQLVAVRTASELRAAVARANASPTPDVIFLRADISLGGRGDDRDGPEAGDLDVRGELRVQGGGHTLDARGGDRHFDVRRGAELTLVGIRLTGGRTTASGGAVRSAGSLAVLRSTLQGNRALGDGASGGAIFNDGGKLGIVGSRLVANTATRAGGGIEARSGRTNVTSSLLTRNVTGPGPGNGGGLHLTGAGVVVVNGSNVIGNVAAAEGGGLWNSATGQLLVETTVVARNRAHGTLAGQGGGGIYNDGGRVRVQRGLVRDNVADGAVGSGGGMLNAGGSLSIRGTQVLANTARRAGGGVEAEAGSTSLLGVLLRANRTGAAPGNGGGLHLTGAGAVSLGASVVSGNRASAEGGGLWNSATGRMVIQGSRILGNSASGDDADQGGGGVYNDGGRLQMSSSGLFDNRADGVAGSGGGLLNVGGAVELFIVGVGRNSAVRAGGGLETSGGSMTLRMVSAGSNRTGRGPGNGGALHLTGPAVVTWTDGSVVNNVAAAEGGGLWNSTTGSLITSGLTVRDNTAPVGRNVYQDEPGGGTFLLNGLPVLPGQNQL